MKDVLTYYWHRDRQVPVYVTYSRRKTMGIKVTRELELEVKAPIGTRRTELLDLVNRNAAWISKHLDQTGQRTGGVTKENVAERFADGAAFPYMGGKIMLVHNLSDSWNSESIGCRLVFDREVWKAYDCGEALTDKVVGTLTLRAQRYQPEIMQQAVEKTMRKSAGDVLKGKVAHWAQRMGISYGRVAIKDGTSRWGSCSSVGNINLQWRLIMMPEAVVDYVIVHELCHRREMNHSAAFWSEVEQVLPNYKQLRGWLKDNGAVILQW